MSRQKANRCNEAGNASGSKGTTREPDQENFIPVLIVGCEEGVGRPDIFGKSSSCEAFDPMRIPVVS